MKSDRRMFVECGIMLAICITFIGVWGFCIIRQATHPEPITVEQRARNERIEKLSDALDAAIEEDDEANGVDRREDYPGYP